MPVWKIHNEIKEIERLNIDIDVQCPDAREIMVDSETIHYIESQTVPPIWGGHNFNQKLQP